MTEEEKQPMASDESSESREEQSESSSEKASDDARAEKKKSDTSSKLAAARAGKSSGTSSKLAAARAGKPGGTSSKVAAARAGKSGGTSSKVAAARAGKSSGASSKAVAARAGGGAKPASDESGKAAASDEQSPSVAPPKKPRVPKKPVVAANENMSRRGGLVMLTSVVTWASVGWTSFSAACAVMLGGLTRFLFPNWLREPPSQFKIGAPGEYAPESVSTKWAAQYGIWVVNTVYEGQSQIYALKTVCTHLGCTPNWLDAEQKFKCPCHGSGFRISGINFEGPAPRPLERYAIQLADDGLLEVDKSQTFQQEMGQWENASSFVTV